MKVLPDKRAILLKVRNPKRLIKLIPTAKLVAYEGRELVAVPHRLDEVRVLNNLGVAAPSPILTEYKWPRSGTVLKPFHAQTETAAFLTLNSRAFVLNDMGTGKTLASLWAYDYLRKRKQAGKLLVVCPMSTMERAWADDLFFHLPHLKFAVLYGTAAKRRKLLADKTIDVYIINHHGVEIILKDLGTRLDITHVVIDEVAQVARNKRTDLWKALNSVINSKHRRAAWGMTAGPIPNAPTDAYAQVKLINPGKAKMYFTAFRDSVMSQLSQFVWVPKPDAVDKVDELMQPAIRFHRSQCMDLPPTIFITRECPLTTDAQKMYDTMRSALVAEAEAGLITAANEAVKVSKLVQIACGVVYAADATVVTVDATPRMALTAELIREADGKAIVFVPFVQAVHTVAKYLENTGLKVGVIYGDVSKSMRDIVFHDFQKTDKLDVIVAQPDAMAHGLTLTAASSTIWYAPTTKAEIYEQANGRTVRPGQKNTTLIIHIEGTAEERRIYYRLKNKQAMQNLLLDRKTVRDAA